MCPYYPFLKFVTKSEERLICYPVLNFVKFSQNNLICAPLSLPASVFQCLHYYCTCYHVYYIHFLRTLVMKILLKFHICLFEDALYNLKYVMGIPYIKMYANFSSILRIGSSTLSVFIRRP
jgi:hypothetical protein